MNISISTSSSNFVCCLDNTIQSVEHISIELDPFYFYKVLDGRQWNCCSIIGRGNWNFSSPNCIGRLCFPSSLLSNAKLPKISRGQKNWKVTNCVHLLSKSRMRGALTPFPQRLYDVVLKISRDRVKRYPYLHFTRNFRC